MNAFANHFSFEFRTGMRNKTLLLMNYLFPLGFYLLMGSIMTQINPLFLDTMIPAMVVFAILAATCWACPTRWSQRARPASFAATRSTACRPPRSWPSRR